MEKKEFISKLRIALLQRGFKPSVIDNEMRSVNGFFETNGITDVQLSVKEMADEITDMLRDKQDKPEKKDGMDDIESALRADGAEFTGTERPRNDKENDNSEGEDEKSSEEKSEEDAGDNTEVKPDETDESDEDMKIVDKTHPEMHLEEGKNENHEELGDEDFSVDDYKPDNGVDDEKAAGLIGKLIKKFKKTARKTDSYLSSDEGAVYDNDHSKLIFWILFSLALPFIIALGLVMVLLYIAFWVVLALIMIFFIAGLIAFVFVGVLVSLIGIIYGVIMVIKGVSPVGLFEIGLGITVGAAVMFVGILVYNFAIRLIPFCMKMLAKLLSFAFKRAREGIGAIKRMLQTV